MAGYVRVVPKFMREDRMELPKEVVDKIHKAVMAEYEKVSKDVKDEKPTLHNIEGAILRIGREFERQLLSATLAEAEKKNKEVKKNAQNVVSQLKAAD
jgi:histone H3/H4